MQRAEVATRALGIGVAADDKLLATLTLDLDPIARPATRVCAGRLLRDDPLETLFGSSLQEGLPVRQDVIGIVNRSERRQEEPEAFLALVNGRRRRS